MKSREFTDRSGVGWRVREITPQLAERRKAERRAAREPAVAAPVIERRAAERRRARAVRARVSRGYEQGWLVFESPDEKRRLAPVPPGWENYSGERLELLCRLAGEDQH